MLDILKNDEKRTLLVLLASFIALAVGFTGEGRLPADASWIAVLLCGVPIIKNAIVGVATKFDIKADVLVSLALIACIIIGEIFAAGEVAFIMTIGSFLEERTVRKARAGIEKLARLTPVAARVIRDGKELFIPAADVQVGDLIRVLAGESVPVDGVIAKGDTSIDQSVMTGESLPVDKGVGDDVSSGTVNQFGVFEMIAGKVGEDSSLQRMIRLVESADAGKAKIVGVADRWATWIVVIALVAAFAVWLATGEIIRSVAILVVFCPCALVLATPAAIMAAIGNLTKYGVLVRQGDALERLAQVKRIAFDKTGTLTYGKPSVALVLSCADDISPEEVFAIAATAELRSEHPLGKALVYGYRQKSKKTLDEPDAFALIPGRGVVAKARGKKIYVGNEALLSDNGILCAEGSRSKVEEAKKDGGIVVYVAYESRVIGLIALEDSLRPDAAEIVRSIQEAGIKTVLLTGDTELSANYVLGRAGLDDVKSSCLPEDKMKAIAEYQANGEAVCMVGDGINDAPSLKAAHVGIAMGGIGSDIAIDAADIALVGDDIKQIPQLLLLSKRTMKTIHVNIAVSMALNFASIILATAGTLNPVIGALVHNVGSVAVIINSSLLLNWRKK
ncbi:MAG: cation-translocating P-type ATPase [Clostridiales bacterium]|nr:cation-translocating P-type ATPase [Clostridiales bacterium]